MRSDFKLTISLTSLLLFLSTAFLAGCGGNAVTTTGTTTTPLAASISLSASSTSVKSDGSSSTVLTATVLSASNAVLAGQAVSFSASTGQLSIASGVTDANGQLTATFSGGTSGVNRTATITAVSDAVTTQLPLQITGSTITATSSSNSVSDDGASSVTVTFTALDAGNTPVTGTAISLTKSGVGNISYTPTSGTTDANGKLIVTVTGVTGGAGSATLTASALGATGSASITVTTTTASFGISGLQLNATALTSANTNSFTTAAMKTSDSLLVTVAAPVATNVTFATTMGVWNGGALNVVTVPVAAGVASATLTTTSAGIATVQVFDPLNPQTSSDSLTVPMTATTPAAITLQATPSVVPKSSGGNTGTSTLIATVTDSNGLPVGDAPVAFSIINPTGGGETVSPVVAYTTTTGTTNLSLGQALTTFTAGSLSSGQNGIQVRAQVLGTAVVTEAMNDNATDSGNDAAIVIGGSAGSVAFGQATVLGVNSNASQYILAMSVMVADSNGNPAPQGTVVNLSLWPIAWSTGRACFYDPDGGVWDGLSPLTNPVYVAGNGGTFFNEDVNENLVLDGTEDGTRNYYADGTAAPGTATGDTHITPANSVAGTVPATVTTDANGIATFDLTYPKTSAIWTVVRIRGKTVVQGSDAVGEVQFRLRALKTDVEPCILPDSPYVF
ncbi:MAG: Ig-like domain-containing protein [Sideroxydans sp.]|nr:Ig-like domain-containing protein [Sideroxydans sp.]